MEKLNKKLAQEFESPFHAYLLLGNTSSHLLKQAKIFASKILFGIEEEIEHPDIKVVSSENLNTLGVEDIRNIIEFEKDFTLVEINPLILTEDNKVIALDAKVNIDDNALFRHKDYLEMRDVREENPIEVEAKEVGLNYVDLDGNVGCMVNGAGLAMATMDLIKQAGGEPANFLDVGGTADSERVETAFRIIIKDPNVKAILVNIFGGIVRCDRVANGIVDACKNMKDEISVPIIVRLEGTNSKIAKEIIS